MTKVDWLQILQDTGAIWKYDPKRGGPHALCTTGIHSNGYINMARVTERPEMLSTMCEALMKKAEGIGFLSTESSPSWIVGPALGSVSIAYECARKLGAKAGFAEKTEKGLQLRRFLIGANEPVLTVDDTMSTGSSVIKTLSCLGDAGLAVLPFALVITNYSKRRKLTANGKTYAIVSLAEFDFDVHRWTPEECPLCKKGSDALRPKENWGSFV